MSNSLALAAPSSDTGHHVSIFDPSMFDHSQRVAKMFSESQMVPVTFQKNLPNVLIAMEISHRMGASQLAVMQSLNIIHGKPSWSAQFIIAAINSSRRFTPLRFVFGGTPGTDSWSCFARAKALADNEELKGATVTIDMAKREGWYGKSGSKWQTMPELMMQYRAATFFGRMFAPDMLMGMQTQEEALDIETVPAPAATATTAPEVTITPEATQTRRRRNAGVAGMKTVEEVAPEATQTVEAAAPVAEKTEPAPAPEPESAAAPAATVPEPDPAPAPAKPALPVIRAEIVNSREVNASTPTGKAVRIEVKGTEFTGVGYYDGPFIKVPADGSIVDVTLERKESAANPGTFVNLIRSIVSIG